MENAIWSMHLARQVAQKLGYGPPDAPLGALGIDFGPEPEPIVREMTEAFRYLPVGKIQEVLDFASFLRSREIDGCSSSQRPSRMAERLREVCDLVLFLRSRYGNNEPADEKDYWTDEDRREWTLGSINRWDEREAAEGEW
jgi:hypothetical protein